MSKKIGLIIIICTILFGVYFYISTSSYFESITSVVVDGDQIRLDVGDVVRYSNDTDGVYFNKKKIGKTLEVFNGIDLDNEYYSVVDELGTYYVEEDFRNDKKMIFFGYKVVENEVIELDYYEVEKISKYRRNDYDDNVILFIVSFDYIEEDYMYCAEDITINYVGRGEYLWMPN